MANDPFNPVDTAATSSARPMKNMPVKKEIQALPKTTGFPVPGDPYWKQHPLLTEHKDGTVRRWGEDIPSPGLTSPYALPKQMMPPPPVVNKNRVQLSDKAKGFSNTFYDANKQQKGADTPTVKSNIFH